MDGILYAIAGGIGFAVVENVLYISAFGLVAAPLRGTAAVLAHIAFSGLAGYYLGRARFGAKPMPTMAVGLAVAAAAHGLYDFLLISPLVSPFVVLLLIAALRMRSLPPSAGPLNCLVTGDSCLRWAAVLQ